MFPSSIYDVRWAYNFSRPGKFQENFLLNFNPRSNVMPSVFLREQLSFVEPTLLERFLQSVVAMDFPTTYWMLSLINLHISSLHRLSGNTWLCIGVVMRAGHDLKQCQKPAILFFLNATAQHSLRVSESFTMDLRTHNRRAIPNVYVPIATRIFFIPWRLANFQSCLWFCCYNLVLCSTCFNVYFQVLAWHATMCYV